MNKKALFLFLIILIIVIITGFFLCFNKAQNHINFARNITAQQKLRINELFSKNHIDFSNKNFIVTNYYSMDTGQDLVTYKIYYKKLPVFAGEPEVDFDQKTDLMIYSINSPKAYLDTYNKINIVDSDLVPKISEQKAIETAEPIITLKRIERDFPRGTKLEAILGIHDAGNQEKSNFILTWRVAPPNSLVGDVPEIYIDALTGNIEEEHLSDL